MILGDDPHRLPIELLRIRGPQVIGPKACFHMAHGDLQIKAGQRGGKSGGGVSLDKHYIRALPLQNGPDPLQNALRYIKEGLALFHDGQIVVRRHAESIHYLVEHLSVLAGDAHHSPDPRAGSQFVDQRAHLDGLRPRAKNQHHFFHGRSLPC